MTASLPAHDVPRELQRDVRRAVRDTQHPIIGGVAGGLARHLAVPVVWVRAAFLVGAVLGGIGIAFYAGLWLVLPAEPPFETEAPGLESAARQGRRPGRIRRLADSGPAIALVALGLGLVLTAEAIFGNGVVIWAMVLAVVGFGLLWRQADEAQRARWLDQSERLNPVRAVFGGRRLGGVRPGRRRRRAGRGCRGPLRRTQRPRARRLHRARRGRRWAGSGWRSPSDRGSGG